MRRRVDESYRFATQWEFKGWAEPAAAADGRRLEASWDFEAHRGGGRS
jgi:hypothetical protein